MKFSRLWLVAVVLLSAIPSAAQPIVSNVRAQQLSDGRVEILYHLSGAPEAGVRISIAVSADGGASYTIYPKDSVLGGDVGFWVTNGSDRRIIWHAALSLPTGTFGPNYRVAVTATETLGEQLTLMLPGDVPLEFVRIPAGTFLMGSPDSERYRNSNEGPQHLVTISKDFFMSKYELTERQYIAVVGSAEGLHQQLGDEFPALVTKFASVLSALNSHLLNSGQLKVSVSIPTEAQWEYAARAGSASRFSFGDALDCYDTDCTGGCSASIHMWWCGNAGGTGSEFAQPTGRRTVNPWGLFDMHGNASEFVIGGCSYSSSAPLTDPVRACYAPSFRGRNVGWVAESRSASRTTGSGCCLGDSTLPHGIRLVIGF